MHRKCISIAPVIAAAILMFGCGNDPPELKQIYSQINFTKTPEGVQGSEFLVLVNAEDKDGEDDIETVYIIRDDEQTFWRVDSVSWNLRNNRGMKWVGCENMTTVDGSLPSPGEYRVLVIDRAGERAEDSVFIPIIKKVPDAKQFPEILFTENYEILEIKSINSRNIISFYDSAGKLLGAYAATPGMLNIKKLKDPSVADNYRTVEISYYSNSTGAGLVAGPYARPRDSY